MSSALPNGSKSKALVTGPLIAGNGPAVAVKDCIDIAGARTTCGSRAFEGAAPAARNAEVVRRLIDADCRIIGKANMHELAYGVTGVNAWTGTPVNVRFPAYVPGGSSSGSAVAVAEGLADFALGTDTGGSIRVPATCCGVFGLKPSYGLVSRVGVHPAESSLDCVGPLARDMAAIGRAMQSIAPGFEALGQARNIRLGCLATDADAEITEALDAALARSGAAISPVSLPSLSAAFEAGLRLIGYELAQQLGHLCGTGLLGADVDQRLGAARSLSARDAASAETVRARFAREVDDALAEVDALVLPSLPAVPLRLDAAEDARAALRMTAFVRPFNLSGHPALSLPLRTQAGAPAGMQLVGRKGGDAALCAIGLALEEALDG